MTEVERRTSVERFDAVTEDPGEIDHLTELMLGTSVRVERNDRRAPSLRLAQAGLPEFGAQRVTWNADGRCDVAPLDRFLCIRLRRGAYGLDQGDGRTVYTPGDVFLADPRRPVDAEVIGADLDSLTIDTASLAEVAAQIAPWSRGNLDFRRATPVDPQTAGVWNAALDYVSDILALGDLVAENRIVRTQTLHQLVAIACVTFALLPEEPQERPATARSVHRAVAYIESHLAEPITVADIAAAAGLSVRGLQSGFLRVLSISPSAYLRRARLHEVRRELEGADELTSISAVARRWGFVHLGRFSGVYRDAFGELPSETRGSAPSVSSPADPSGGAER